MWLLHQFVFLIFFVIVAVASSDTPYDQYEVKSLPGWQKPLPSRQYSGFVNANQNASLQMHFWFIESEGDPEDDPLVLWFNGGPGASSLYGLLVELGPFRLNDLSLMGPEYQKTKVPQLIYNPSSWAQSANILALSMPIPVGFSYCSPPGPSAQGNDCGSSDDDSTAEQTYYALNSWLKIFSNFQKNEMFITGESYAGVYVPMLAQQILNDPESDINLKGIAVGDACTPPATCSTYHWGPWVDIAFLYGKNAFSTKLMMEINERCSKEELYTGENMTDVCSESVGKIHDEAVGYWVYSYYDDCYYENDIRRALTSIGHTMSDTNSNSKYQYHGPPILNGRGVPYSQIPNGYICGGGGIMEEWLTLEVVKEALNVPKDAVFFQCDNGEDFTYTLLNPDIISWYKEVLSKDLLRILVYNGDTDPAITAYQAEQWTREMGFKEVQSWRAWTTDSCQRVGGSVIRYEHNLDFLTIKGSGHMVPEFKPEVSLEFITRWIKNDDYKIYDSSCLAPPPQYRNRNMEKKIDLMR